MFTKFSPGIDTSSGYYVVLKDINIYFWFFFSTQATTIDEKIKQRFPQYSLLLYGEGDYIQQSR